MTRIADPQGHEIAALDRLVELQARDVIDVGCGEGRTACRIARTAGSVLGVDPDADRIARARSVADDQGADGCTFLEADAVTLDMAPASFDVVLFSRSL